MDVREELDEALDAAEGEFSPTVTTVSVNRGIYLTLRALREIIRLLDGKD